MVWSDNFRYDTLRSDRQGKCNLTGALSDKQEHSTVSSAIFVWLALFKTVNGIEAALLGLLKLRRKVRG